MSPKFEIIEARPHMCGQMSRLLRAEHRSAVAALGVDAHRELRSAFDQSAFRRAWLIDGRLAALGGVTGSPLNHYGQIWLALSSTALRYPKAIVQEARRQIDEIMATRHQIVTSIVSGDEAAKRFAIFLGFVPYDTVCDEEIANSAVSRGQRRWVRKIADSVPELRAPIGAGYAITMSYSQREAA